MFDGDIERAARHYITATQRNRPTLVSFTGIEKMIIRAVSRLLFSFLLFPKKNKKRDPELYLNNF